MVSRDMVQSYQNWLDEQEGFLYAVQHDHVFAPVGAMLEDNPRCDLDVSDPEMRNRTQTGTHKWVEDRDGCPPFLCKLSGKPQRPLVVVLPTPSFHQDPSMVLQHGIP